MRTQSLSFWPKRADVQGSEQGRSALSLPGGQDTGRSSWSPRGGSFRERWGSGKGLSRSGGAPALPHTPEGHPQIPLPMQ